MNVESELNRSNIASLAVSPLATYTERAVFPTDGCNGSVFSSADAAAACSEAEFLIELGKHLRRLRDSCDMSRRELAGRSGVSERYIASIEGGKGNVSVILLLRLSSALHAAIVGR